MHAAAFGGRAKRDDTGAARAGRGDAHQRSGDAGASGRVERSSRLSQRKAAHPEPRHIVPEGSSDAHTAGRRGSPNRRQRRSSSSCTQATPAGLPCGMPGIGELIDGAMQQAAQRGRQSIAGIIGVA